MADIASGFEQSGVEEIVEGLTQVVADLVVETMKAQNFHWNVTGMAFGPLHALFQQVYEDHFTAQDLLAERAKALGAHAEGRLSALAARSAIRESDGKIAAEEMVAQLAADQEAISTTLRALSVLAERHGDVVTQDIAVERANVHDKFAWLLRAHIS